MATQNALNINDAGIVSYDGAGTFSGRTLTAGSGVSISNGDGISGNPTISASASVPITFHTSSGDASALLNILNIVNGTGISASGASNNLTLAVSLSGLPTVATTYTADSGSATPSANNLNILGTSTQGLTTSGSGATLTLTNADWTTAQKGVGTLATNAETIAGTVTNKAVTPDDLKAKLGAQTSHGFAIGAGTTSAITWSAAPTNGQVLIGSTGSDPVPASLTQPAAGLTITGGAGSITFALADDLAALEALASTGVAVRTGTSTWTTRTLTAGTGISITNGDGVSGNPTISTTGPGFPWTDVTTATQAISVNNGYATDRGAGVVYTLPATATFGDVIKIDGKLGLTTITPNASQQILMGANSGTVGVTGTAVATNVGDCITLRCTTGGSSTVWRAENWVGNWTLN